MRTLIYTVAIGLGLLGADAAIAQPRPGGPRPSVPDAPDSKQLLEKLDKLDARLKELEARLASAKGSERPAAKLDFGRADPFGRGFGPRARFGSQGFDRSAFGRRPADGPRGRDAAAPADIQQRLDRVIAELEQLRKDVGRPRR